MYRFFPVYEICASENTYAAMRNPASTTPIRRLTHASQFPKRVRLGSLRGRRIESERRAWLQERIDNRDAAPLRGAKAGGPIPAFHFWPPLLAREDHAPWGRNPNGRKPRGFRRATRDSTRSPATHGAGEAPKHNWKRSPRSDVRELPCVPVESRLLCGRWRAIRANRRQVSAGARAGPCWIDGRRRPTRRHYARNDALACKHTMRCVIGSPEPRLFDRPGAVVDAEYSR